MTNTDNFKCFNTLRHSHIYGNLGKSDLEVNEICQIINLNSNVKNSIRLITDEGT